MSDRWVGGKLACKRMGGHMPDEDDMEKLIRAFYEGCNGYDRCKNDLSNVDLAKN